MWDKYNRCIVLCSEGHSIPSLPSIHDDVDQQIESYFEAFDDLFHDW
ncbi:hypothetical protein [Pseudoalteromonas piscicida]|nr:hypothetical protein [Pseudoalteromonas piscicida]